MATDRQTQAIIDRLTLLNDIGVYPSPIALTGVGNYSTPRLKLRELALDGRVMAFRLGEENFVRLILFDRPLPVGARWVTWPYRPKPRYVATHDHTPNPDLSP